MRLKYQLQPEPMSFLYTAKHLRSWQVELAAEQRRVYEAISGDPGGWRGWFPGFRSGSWLEDGGEPGSAGARREIRLLGGVRMRETVMVWEEPHQWAYRVDECSVPMAHRLIEVWAVTPSHSGSVVTWTFAADAMPPVALTLRYAPSVMGATFRRAMRNLDRRLASTHADRSAG